MYLPKRFGTLLKHLLKLPVVPVDDEEESPSGYSCWNFGIEKPFPTAFVPGGPGDS